ncbi:metalloprotease TldD [Photobacterium piscicola]|uniref:Metalloprotease TldD n=1 Tax=Photobacterium piscicola TaxID=1378299 RepID=A0ABU6LN49_9GAMM|nr:metalloprotease TldD [Photobacterium piscicola]MEC6883443.1 metalloprotease TldD [Photobacterium piscicola]MEC6899390.1 metalloprotease TldD [Photobacterium piscicola]
MTLNTVESTMLDQSGLGRDELHNILGLIATRDVDYADIYFQSCWHESLVLEDSIIKDGSFNIDRGVGVRAVAGEKTGFAYSDQINLLALTQSAKAARGIVRQGGNGKVQTFTPMASSGIYSPINPLGSFDKFQKIALLEEIDRYIRTKEPLVTEVSASINGVYEEVLVAALDGTYAADIRPLVRLSITVLVEKGDKRERGSAGGGGRYGYERFLTEDTTGKSQAIFFADEAIRQALVNLEADAAPAGTMPIVLGAGWPGVLLHEAVGHGLEGDFNRKGSSMFAGQMGQQVTSPLCTIVDDGTLVDRRGSINIDDEGTPAQHNVLVEGGKLKGYMQDKLNARLMGVAATGNGRRESYAHLPMPRMTNTYMLPGEHTPEEIIASVKNGIYAPNFGGGQVDITSGKFVFSASEAYLIENGKVTRPIKGATLIGSGIEAMQQVSMVGNDLDIDRGVGVCGKAGQSVPVGVGQPTLKIDSMTVGGTE